MSSEESKADTDRNNQKIADLENKDMTLHKEHLKSINPFVTVKGNILVSDCCGAEMLYNVSDKYGLNMWGFCPQCLDCCETLEVKEDYNREIHLNKNDDFEIEGYDKKNFEIIPKCHSETYTKEDILTKCFYCKTSTDEIQGHKVGLLSFKLNDSLIIKACEDCYFKHEEELKDNEMGL